ncbi:MAG: AAA+ ATPase superfamily predicted ATPase [Saprospiraceae bacterium]|jgi:AAA+ ATPase superfamily predicted ATPase
MKDLIGRQNEQKIIQSLLNSSRSEFAAFFGRRRVGKTFFIREYFQYNFDFQLTGLANADTSQQLFNFYNAFNRQSPLLLDTPPKSWLEAFEHLKDHIELTTEKRKKVVFIDEIPWLDTAKSDFMIGLESFWNHWASARKDIFLIVCGSAASWMINQLINNSGGLHNRVTREVKIEPFTLSEVEAYLLSRGHICTRYQIIQLYMVTGGVPFYLDRLKTELSILQNIDELCFSKSGVLRNEFQHLFKSLFNKFEKHEKIVETLSQKAIGMTRQEILDKSKLKSGGTFSKVIEELELSGFITSYGPIDKKIKDTLYRLSDFYTLFYFKFIQTVPHPEPNYWVKRADSPSQRAWAGYAFEQVCLAHTEAIKSAIGISGVSTSLGSWRGKHGEKGVQIDMLIERNDGVTNICEMKFSISEFTITKSYADNLRTKISVYKNATKTKNAIQLITVTTYGVSKNAYASELVQKDITMDDLF